MPRPLVIIHGWSDTSASFQTLASLIAQRRAVNVSVISLGDYISLSDYVTFRDVVAAMDKAWTDHGLPRAAASVDAIVHSTGGLVIRDWMSTFFKPAAAPVKNLVMLAPANFGSPLAHKGRSFIGRVVKGWDSPAGAFQTGTQILKGLELASPYSWDLAMRDRLGDWAAAYGPGRILCTVLVGNKGYPGIASIANEDGADGTVRVSTANMNAALLQLDFASDPLKPKPTLTAPDPTTAFGVMNGLNHSDVKLDGSKLKSESDQDLFNQIIGALDVTDGGFKAWQGTLAARTTASVSPGNSQTHAFQNTVVRVRDQDGTPVRDYLIEFYEEDDDKDLIAKLFHTTALADVHPYGDDPSYRSLYINCTRLSKTIDKIEEALRISLTAYPVLGGNSKVGFRGFDDTGIGSVRIPQASIGKYFAGHRTLLVDVTIRRERTDEVFRFRPATG